MRVILMLVLIFIAVPTADAHWKIKKEKQLPKQEYLDRLDGIGRHYIYNWTTKKWERDLDRK